MTNESRIQKRQWMSLGAACSILEVNGATLRQWADKGLVRAFRTPGGHRRFSTADLYALMERPTTPSDRRNSRRLDEATLLRIRRRLRGQQAVGQRWYEAIDEEGRTRMRLLGRRLLTLTTEYLVRRRRRSELLEEARLVGEEEGVEAARRHLPLRDTVQAFLFFRNSLADAVREVLRSSGARIEELLQTWQHITQLADAVLLSLMSAYEAEQHTLDARQPIEAATMEGS